jgi:hypothetical protein
MRLTTPLLRAVTPANRIGSERRPHKRLIMRLTEQFFFMVVVYEASDSAHWTSVKLAHSFVEN